MASGRIKLTTTAAYGAWYGYIDWESTHDIAANASIVVAKLYSCKIDGNTTGGNTNGYYGVLKIGTEQTTFYYTNEYNDYNMVGELHATLTASIPHDDTTGEGSTVISAKVEGPGGTSLAYKTLSGSEDVDLGTIARVSEVSVDKSTVQMGSNLLITIDQKNADFTHDLYYESSDGSVSVLFASGVKNSYAWTVPDLASIVSGSGGEIRIRCVTYSGSTRLGETSVTVNVTVQDATIPSIEGNTATMGTGKTITCKRQSTNFRIVLKFSMGTISETIADGKFDSYTWTPSYNYAKTIPNLTSGTGTLACETYNGSTRIGSASIPVKLDVPDNDVTKPAFTSSQLSLSLISDLTGYFAGLYIRGRTGIRADFSATSEYSTIQDYSLTVGTVSAEGNPAVIDTIVNDGTVAVKAKVTDARGYSRTVQTTIYVYPYQKPKITPYTGYSAVVCERAKTTGELSADGTMLAIRAGRSYSSFVVSGSERNACTLRYRYRQSVASSYGSWVTLLGAADSRTEISVLVSGVVSSTSTSYDVELEAVDSLGGSHTMRFQIMTGNVSFVLYDGVDGAGFGKYPEHPHVVDVASHMTLLVRGQLVVTGSGWQELSFASGIHESAYQVGRAVDCKYRVSEGNHVYAAFNAEFTYQGSALTVNAAAIPEAYRPEQTVYALCAVNGNGTAVVSVTPEGFIRVENVKRDGESGNIPVLWIDGYIDYFI